VHARTRIAKRPSVSICSCVGSHGENDGEAYDGGVGDGEAGSGGVGHGENYDGGVRLYVGSLVVSKLTELPSSWTFFFYRLGRGFS